MFVSFKFYILFFLIFFLFFFNPLRCSNRDEVNMKYRYIEIIYKEVNCAMSSSILK